MKLLTGLVVILNNEHSAGDGVRVRPHRGLVQRLYRERIQHTGAHTWQIRVIHN